MTPARVEGAGVELAYDERGAGPPVVLVHGTGATRGFWAETRDALGDERRAIAYDRRGYGDSGAPEEYSATTVGEHADDLIALIRGLDAGPVVLCGHSFGAVTILDALAHAPELARAAVLIEPGMFWLAQSGAAMSSALRAAAEKGAREDGAAGAIDAFITGTGGPGAPGLLGRERLEEAHRAAVPFAAEVAASADWSLPRRELRALDVPVKVIAGANSPAAFREASEALAAMLPRAELLWAEAGHLVPIEAPDAVADAVRMLSQP